MISSGGGIKKAVGIRKMPTASLRGSLENLAREGLDATWGTLYFPHWWVALESNQICVVLQTRRDANLSRYPLQSCQLVLPFFLLFRWGGEKFFVSLVKVSNFFL